MQAVTVIPGMPDSIHLEERPVPAPADDEYLIRTLLVGLCGTDREMLERTPSATKPLIMGHESLGVVVRKPAAGAIPAGTLVVGVIRGACTALCPACEAGRYDQCASSPLVERGLYEADGYACEYWTASEPGLVVVDPALGEHGILVEPLSSLIKAQDRLRAVAPTLPLFRHYSVLIAGAGPIGVLAAWLFGQDFAGVTVVDPSMTSQAESALATLGTVRTIKDWSAVGIGEFDAVIECSGSIDALSRAVMTCRIGGAIVLEGIPHGEGWGLSRECIKNMVMRDLTVLATVNASRAQYQRAADELLHAPHDFLDQVLETEIGPADVATWTRHAASGLKTVVRFSH